MSATVPERPPLLIPVGLFTEKSERDALIDVAAVVRGQCRGADPTATWRLNLWRWHQSGYADAPVSVAVTFVAQWVLQSVVCAVIAVDRSGGRLKSPLSVSIALDSVALYPKAVLIEPAQVLSGRDPDPHAAYQRAALAFIDPYRPGIAMSSRQRRGLVHDVWQAATVNDRSRRQSCCFLYALAGMRVCAGCPRVPVDEDLTLAPRANRGT